MGTNKDVGGGSRRAKIICFTVAMLTWSSLVLAGFVLWVAFDKSDSPTIKVQRLSIPKFDIEADLSDDQVVMSAEFEFFMESKNKNSMTSTKLDSMVMSVSWHDNRVEQIGKSKVDSVKLASGDSDVIQIKTSGETDIKNKKLLTKEEIKVDVVLSGTLVFSYGPFTSDTFAFLVKCNGVSLASRDTPCSSTFSPTKKPI